MDLWVLMTVLPERRQKMHFSEPYLEAESCFLVEANSPFHESAQLKTARIGYRNIPIMLKTLGQLMPHAQFVPAVDTAGTLNLLTEGRADAAFADQHDLIISLLQGGEQHAPLRILPADQPRRPLAIASTFANAAVADELRGAITTMTKDGSVTKLVELWTFTYNPATAVIGELAEEKIRVRELAFGLIGMSLIIVTMVGLIVWLYRQSVRLRETKALLRKVADRVPGLVYQYRLNPDGSSSFPYTNEAIRQIYRVSPESVRNDAAGAFASLHPDDRYLVISSIRQSADALTPWKQEYRIKFGDGTERWLAGNAQPQRESDGTVLFHGFITDITERKEAEAAKQLFDRKIQETQRLESLGLLASGIAHDFNNILTGILGYTGLASQSITAGSPAQEYLLPIREGCIRAAELCKQMLAYSGKGSLVIRKTSLNTLVEETTQLLQMSISKQASLRLNLAPNLPAIEADTIQIRQVVMNLVINASDAVGPLSGTIGLSTSLRRVAQDELTTMAIPAELPAGTYVCLEVSDTGCGMSAETQARIFEPFFTTKFTGRGLGLSAVHGIVRAHKGVLKVYSELGRGTTFRLFFPASDGAADLEAKRANAEPESNWRGQGLILVVDDEESVRQTVSAMLRKLGFTVELANDGREGVERFRAYPDRFTAVVMDLAMPVLDLENRRWLK